MEKNKKRNLLFGFLSGIVLPFLIIWLVYLIKFGQFTFQEFLALLFGLRIAGNFIQLAGISNLILFFIFLKINKLYLARGVIFATLILAIIVAVLIFL